MAKIAIDAGHGLNTEGKRALKSLDKNETREWVLNDRVADALEASSIITVIVTTILVIIISQDIVMTKQKIVLDV